MFKTLDIPEGHEGTVEATYRVKSSLPIDEVADSVCAEQSTGTWQEVGRETEGLVARHGAETVAAHDLGDEYLLRIAFPVENFGPVVPMLLSSVAGNLYEMGSFEAVRLVDLEFPESFVEEFEGPSHGIEGCREVLRVSDRPLIGTIIKPNVGLPVGEFAEACYEAAVGGVDFIKDDELVANPDYSPLEERVSAVMERLDEAEEETGERKMFAANVTAEVGDILERAEEARDAGANCLMLNFVTAGFSALRRLTSEFDLPVHCHRDMFAAFTRPEDHGVSPAVINKLVRLCGGDQAHIGSVDGKLYEPNVEVVKNARVLTADWGVGSCLPVSSGGLHAGKVPANVDALGADTLILAGGGIHGHPSGTEAGARSMRQALRVHGGEDPEQFPEYLEAVDHMGGS